MTNFQHTPLYRLTIYARGQIERILPFDSPSLASALGFAESQRYGHCAVLSDLQGVLKRFPDDEFKEVADRLLAARQAR